VAIPGIFVVQGPRFTDYKTAKKEISDFSNICVNENEIQGYPLIIIADDSRFVSASLSNFLWVTFTRSDPARDIHGIGAFIRDKHWGCSGPLIIDARIKPHHAPILEEDEHVQRRIERLGKKGASLCGYLD
jgi:4-hydroxy-3-polyprenylbenzoate decarboxylase